MPRGGLSAHTSARDESAPSPGGRRPSSTRSTPAASPTPTATASATSAGILARLDYLAWLGVDVLWLSPVYPSPQDDAGYDISDYQDIDPVFGTLADFDALLAAVHERGMRLVMDLVVNHTSDEHPWFVEARSGPDSAKRDWYWWRPPREGMAAGAPGAEPTNWGSAFSGPAWTLDEASRRVLPAPVLAASSPTSTGRTRRSARRSTR